MKCDSPDQSVLKGQFPHQMPPQGPLLPFAICAEMAGPLKDSPLKPEEFFWTGRGPHETEILARRDGFIIFQFDKAKNYAGGEVPGFQPVPGERWPAAFEKARDQREALAYRRFVYMNAFLAAFNSGMSVVQKTGGQVQAPLNPSNYFHAAFIGGVWQIAAHTGGSVEPQVVRNIDIETLNHAVSVMMACDQLFGERGLRPLALVQIACHHYALHQFETAHLLAWSVIEKQLHLLWARHLDELSAGEKPLTVINAKRRSQLTGRDYTASMISQMLSLAGKIDDTMLDALNRARDKRNKFAHMLADVNADDAGKAIRTATDFLSKIIGMQVGSQLALGFHF